MSILKSRVEEKLKHKNIVLNMSDGSKWNIPVFVVALHHAEIHTLEINNEMDIDVFHKELDKTISFFNDNYKKIIEWLTKHMKWVDVVTYAKQVLSEGLDFDAELLNCKSFTIETKEVV
jgi:CRISPR/Cas system-associated endonuclease Cas3-HD